MLTMPIAGFLADKIGPGKVVLDRPRRSITVGMGDARPRSTTTRRTATSSRAFVVMGLGMGSTMMPVFTAALASLKRPRRSPAARR